jgi:hypothetical protein
VRNLAWLFLERFLVRAVYLTVTIIAAARLDAPSLAVALAANAIVGLPQAFGDQAVNGLVFRRASLGHAGAVHIRRTVTVVAASLAVVTAVASIPVQGFTGIPGLAAVGAVLAVIIPVAAHAGISTSILQRAGRQRTASAARASAAGLSGAAWVPVMAQTGSEWALVGFYVTTDLVAAIALWILSRGVLGAAEPSDPAEVGSSEVLKFMAAVGPANCLNWLSFQGFGLVCAAGLAVEDYAELALYLAILRVGLDLVAGPFAVSLQVGLARAKDLAGQDSLIIRSSQQLTGVVLLVVVAVLCVDPHRVLGWIGKEQFDSTLLLWLLVTLPMQAVSWLDRPVLIHRHLERTDLHLRLWLALADTAIALSSGMLGLDGLGIAIVVRFVVSRVAIQVWLGDQAAHCRFPQALPSLAFATVGGIGILAGHGRASMVAVGGVLAVLLIVREVKHLWDPYSSTRAMPGVR